jgi:hypothetical protein
MIKALAKNIADAPRLFTRLIITRPMAVNGNILAVLLAFIAYVLSNLFFQPRKMYPALYLSQHA